MSQKDRIKVAILDHSPDLGGAEVAILTFLRNIDRSQFDVTVILSSRGTFSKVLEESSIPISIIHLPMGLIRLKRGKAFQSFFFLLAFSHGFLPSKSQLKFVPVRSASSFPHFQSCLPAPICL